MTANNPEMDHVDVRISHSVKLKAKTNVEKSGLTLSEYVRIVLTGVAENGLPDDFALPNKQVVESIAQFVDSLEGETPLDGGTVEDFERHLNE